VRYVVAFLVVTVACAAAASGYGARRDVTLTLSSAKLSASWKESWLTGSVKFAGTVTGPADLTAVVRPVGRAGPPVAAGTFSTTGSFSQVLKLPARPLPGKYRLTVSGQSSGTRLTATRDLTLPAPIEGIVDQAYASSTKGGAPIKTVKSPRTELWVHYHFVVKPKLNTVRVGWHSPDFRWYGQRTYPYKATVESRVHTTGGLTLKRGVWYVYIWSSDRVVKRASIRIN
jgi:hypothetical protein